jgi:hypothetical protein
MDILLRWGLRSVFGLFGLIFAFLTINPARTALKRLDKFILSLDEKFKISEKFIKPFQRYFLMRKRNRGTNHLEIILEK